MQTDFVDTATYLKQWVVFIITALVKRHDLLYLEKKIKRVTRKKELDEMQKRYIEEKGYLVVEMWECERWKLYKTGVSVKEHLREALPYKRSLRRDQYLEKLKASA